METREQKNKKMRNKIIKEEREKKIGKGVKIITSILIIVLAILCYGMFIGAKYTVVLEHKVTNKNLPSSYHGIKVVQLSDILINSLSKNDLTNIKNKVNKLKPDILVFTGDLKKEGHSLSKAEIDVLENFFKGLESTIGRFAVIGDNDDDSFHVIMENSNFEILNNSEKILYYKNNEPIKIIGFDTSNLKAVETDKNYYSICLLHNPDKIDEIIKSNTCSLALAGDTLGGEIRIPFTNIGIFDNHKYHNDYYKLKQTELYINNGLGNNNNIRLFDRPSISLYRLTKY